MNNIQIKGEWENDEIYQAEGMIEYNNNYYNLKLLKINNENNYDYKIEISLNDKIYITKSIAPSTDIETLCSEIIKSINEKIEQEKLELERKEQEIKIAFYNKHLKDKVFQKTGALSKIIPELNLAFDIHSLLMRISITIKDENTLIYYVVVDIDKSKLKRFDRGYLIQQVGIAEKLDVPPAIHSYKVQDGYIIFGDKRFKLNLQKQTLYDEKYKVELPRYKE